MEEEKLLLYKHTRRNREIKVMGTKNTDLVANFEATPQVKNNAAELHGVLRTAHGTVELAAGDSDNDDIVMLAPIPSNAAVPSLFVGSDTFGIFARLMSVSTKQMEQSKMKTFLLQMLLMQQLWQMSDLRLQTSIQLAKKCMN